MQTRNNGICTSREFLTALKYPYKSNQKLGARKAASQVRAVLHTYSWTRLQSKLRSNNGKIVSLLDKELNTQTSANVSKFGLRVFGYIALFISKAYPDTLTQAISLCTSSTLYTLHSLYLRVQQVDTWK